MRIQKRVAQVPGILYNGRHNLEDGSQRVFHGDEVVLT